MKSCYAEFRGGHAEFRGEKQRKALFTFPVSRFPLILTYQPVVIAKMRAG
jgi:hypothetical protein